VFDYSGTGGHVKQLIGAERRDVGVSPIAGMSLYKTSTSRILLALAAISLVLGESPEHKKVNARKYHLTFMVFGVYS